MWRSVCGVDAPHTAQWLEYQLWVVRASWDLKSQMTTSALSHNTPIELQMNPRREKWSQQIDCIFRMVCISTQSRDHTKHYKHHSYSCTHLSHEPYTWLYCNTVLGVTLDDNITIVTMSQPATTLKNLHSLGFFLSHFMLFSWLSNPITLDAYQVPS